MHTSLSSTSNLNSKPLNINTSSNRYNENIKEMTIEEIFCGSEELEYEGLLNIMNNFVDENIFDEEIKKITKLHLSFIEKRAKGKNYLIYISIFFLILYFYAFYFNYLYFIFITNFNL